MDSQITPPILLQSIIRTLNGSNFAATVGDFYRGEIAVLNAIDLFEKEKKEVFPSMISSYLQVSRPTITSALRILEHKKYVKRTLYEEDRRKVSVALTNRGSEVVDQKRREIDSWCYSMSEHFGNEHFTSVLGSIKELLEYME